MNWITETPDGKNLSWNDHDSERFSEDLSSEMRAIFSQISWTAKSALISEHEVSSSINTRDVIALIRDVENFNKKTRLGLREVTPDLVFAVYTFNTSPCKDYIVDLMEGKGSVKIEDWEGWAIAFCKSEEGDLFVFVGFSKLIRDFCLRDGISTDSMGVIGIKLGWIMQIPVRTSNAELENDGFVFVV